MKGAHWIAVLLCAALFGGCVIARKTTKTVVKGTGKVAGGAAKTTGKAVGAAAGAVTGGEKD